MSTGPNLHPNLHPKYDEAIELRNHNLSHKCYTLDVLRQLSYAATQEAMPDTEVCCPHSYHLQPVSLSLPPAKGLYGILESLQEFTTNRPSTSVVCNLSYSNLSFEHAKYIAAWLQVPGRNVRLYALELSFNRIVSPSWAAFVPLLEWLRSYVCHMDFAGNICQKSLSWTS